MALKLTRPLAFIDLETTGLRIGIDRIIEISILKLFPDGHTEIYTQRINPEMPIDDGAYEVHGVRLEDLQNEPTFDKAAKTIINYIDNADLAGFNIMKFDLPLIVEEFMRVNADFKLDGRKVIDSQHIFHRMEKRNLTAAYKFYCGKTIENAHSAEADIQATYEVLLAQVDHYDNLSDDIDGLYEFLGKPLDKIVDFAGRIAKNNKGEAVFNFGKYKGKKVTDVFSKDPAYYRWMMNGEFPAFTKKKLTELYIEWKKN